jgi:nucleoid DNA-binding protein
MTKREMVVKISGQTGLPQEQVYTIVQSTLDAISEAIGRGDHIELREFGVFDVCVRRSRVGRNPNRPEHVVKIPERHVVKFKAGKQMRARLKKLDEQRASRLAQRPPMPPPEPPAAQAPASF